MLENAFFITLGALLTAVLGLCHEVIRRRMDRDDFSMREASAERTRISAEERQARRDERRRRVQPVQEFETHLRDLIGNAAATNFGMFMQRGLSASKDAILPSLIEKGAEPYLTKEAADELLAKYGNGPSVEDLLDSFMPELEKALHAAPNEAIRKALIASATEAFEHVTSPDVRPVPTSSAEALQQAIEDYIAQI